MRFRRRRYLLLRVADDAVLDIEAFRSQSLLSILLGTVPLSQEALPVTAAELRS
jgi:hypothetical protein